MDKENKLPKFKILIADNEIKMHTVTFNLIHDYKFDEFSIEFLHAFNRAQALDLLMKNQDIVMTIVNEKMDSPIDGIAISRFIREELDNNTMKIVLRTKDSSYYSIESFIYKYNIGDCKTSSELKGNRLFRLILSSVNQYVQMLSLDGHRIELQKIIKASSDMHEYSSQDELLKGFLMQISSLIDCNSNDSLVVKWDKEGQFEIVAALGDYDKDIGLLIDQVELSHMGDHSLKSHMIQNQKHSLEFFDNYFIATYQSSVGCIYCIYYEHKKDSINRNLLKVFMKNSSILLDKFLINDKIYEEQREMIISLGEFVEKRDKWIHNHVVRVSKLSRVLASKLDFDEDEITKIELASSIHDVGKLVVPDNILNKPGKLDVEEFETIKKHTTTGFHLFEALDTSFLEIIKNIIRHHHEWWNGNGYPDNLIGERIPVEARLVAIIDVFDALTSERPYKKAWTVEKAVEYIEKQSSIQFDPRLVDIFMDSLDEIIEVMKVYSDEKIS